MSDEGPILYTYTDRNPNPWEESRDLWIYHVEFIYLWFGLGSPENIVSEPFRGHIGITRTEEAMNMTAEQRAEIVESRREVEMSAMKRALGTDEEPVVVDEPPEWVRDYIQWGNRPSAS